MNYILHILVMICIYLILALSLNLLVGYGGLLSIAHAAFYGIGAYATTLLMMKAGLNFFIALAIGVIIAMVLSLSVALPSLRLKGDYFVLASMGFQVIVFEVLYNWVGLTRGPYGIPAIPRPRLFGLEFDSLPSLFLLGAILAGFAFLLLYLVSCSPFGRALKAVRDDEAAALALGKNVAALKTWAFVLACGIAAIAGGLFAVYMSYIDPTSFTLAESIFILAVVLVGGSGNIKGPVVGALLMVILPELLRFLRIPDTVAPQVRQMIFGALLVFLMRFRPQGIAGEYALE